MMGISPKSSRTANPAQTTAFFGAKRGYAGRVLTGESPCAVGEASGKQVEVLTPRYGWTDHGELVMPLRRPIRSRGRGRSERSVLSADPGQVLPDRLFRLLHFFLDVLDQTGRQLVLQVFDLVLFLLELLHQPRHVLLERANTPGALPLDAPDFRSDRFRNGHVRLL